MTTGTATFDAARHVRAAGIAHRLANSPQLTNRELVIARRIVRELELAEGPDRYPYRRPMLSARALLAALRYAVRVHDNPQLADDATRAGLLLTAIRRLAGEEA